MRKVKLIAMDLDGTLLNDRKEITQYTVETLRKIREQNIILVISSGRMMEAINKFQAAIGLKCYRSSMNGAYIVDEESRPIFSKQFQPEVLQEIISLLAKKKVFFNLSTEDTLYCLSENDVLKRRNYGVKTKYLTSEEMLSGTPKKVNRFIVETTNMSLLHEISKHIQKEYHLEITKSAKHNIEVMPEKVNKGNGLSKICSYVGIHRVNTLVFGDGDNDMSLFEAAGVKVAMKNACAALKNKADIITESNNDDGVAKVLQTLLD